MQAGKSIPGEITSAGIHTLNNYTGILPCFLGGLLWFLLLFINIQIAFPGYSRTYRVGLVSIHHMMRCGRLLKRQQRSVCPFLDRNALHVRLFHLCWQSILSLSSFFLL